MWYGDKQNRTIATDGNDPALKYFMVVLGGDMMTMPGLPKVPASDDIDIDEDGQIVGLS